jgi:mono/diheme cytochrome c family protein
MIRVFRVTGLIAVSICLEMGLAATAARSQTLAPPTFTAAQAKRGEAIYLDKCMSCHGDDLANGEFGSPLKGSFFREQWSGKGLNELLTYISTSMPPDAPGGLGPATYADVLAFVLSKNEVAASGIELPADAEKLKGMALPAVTPEIRTPRDTSWVFELAERVK